MFKFSYFYSSIRYSAEYIAKELLERGVCSFIPSMLLKMMTNGKYEKLTVSTQTKTVQALGLSPMVIESTLSTLGDSIENAKKIVNNIILANKEDRQSVILSILHNIACGNAISKQDSCLCLMTAMGNNCPYKYARQCIGCQYEISTKSTIYVLISEFNRLLALREESTNEYVKNKYSTLLKETVVPAIAEIFTCVKDSYGEDALHEMEKVIKEAQNE